jgi:hypothetical protein
VPEAHAIDSAAAAVEKALAAPVVEPRYIVMQVLRALEDEEELDAAADAEMITDMAEAWGIVVRCTWMEWALEQPNCKPSWVEPWATLEDRQKDVDRRIAIAVANHVLAHLKREKHRLIAAVDELILHERQTRGDMVRFHETSLAELIQPSRDNQDVS